MNFRAEVEKLVLQKYFLKFDCDLVVLVSCVEHLFFLTNVKLINVPRQATCAFADFHACALMTWVATQGEFSQLLAGIMI